MRFGCDFRQLQIPLWRDRYLGYDKLKQTLKQQSYKSDIAPQDRLESRLTQEIDEINGFLQSQLNFFYGWIEATLSRFSLPAISLKLEDLSQVVPSELHDLCENLREVLEFSAQLETFASLNRDAVQRLLAKYGQSSVHPCVDDCELRGLLYASPWMNTACRLRDLMSLATRAQALHQGTHSTQSLLLQRVSPIALGCTSDEVHRCLRSDDPASLMVVLASPVSYMDNQAMLYSVLQVAIIHQATMCVKSLLEEITAPLDEQECTHRDVLHQLIINTVRCRSSHDSLDVLTETFRELSPYQHHLMVVKDWRQRYALHYAAEHGLVELCRQLLKFMSPMAITERDAAGLTPLHLAIHGNHMTVVKNLLSADGAFALLSAAVIGDLLQLAVQRGLVEVCKYLVTIGRGLNFVDKRSCTPLYNAADHGHVGLVETLLTVSPALDINRVEGAYGWSALTVASVRGHLQIVKLLLQSGADVKSKDCRGWSAIEHASYRAHMAVVTAIEEASVSVDAFDVPSDAQVCSSATRPTDLLRPTYFSSDEPTPQSILPVASIFVNLGTLDITSSNSILDFEPTFTDYLTTRSSGHMFLEISGTPCREEPYVVRLPLLGDVSERTWLFSTPEPGKLRLKFNIWEYMGNAKTSKKLLATGVVLLGSIRGWFRPERQSLKRDSLVALSTPEGEYAGTVAFTHLVCQSYKAPTTVKAIQKMRSMTSTQVIGHRGLGWNMSGLGRMQIGEHTIQSLQSALDQGADLIEFDVQTTRDRVPVIYHDWTCSETGLDVPIHAMTFNQWMAISESQTNFHHDPPRGRLPWDERTRPSAPSRRESRSLCAQPDHPRKAMADRMKHTVEYARNHNKGNIRGECIHDAFTTLRELFQKFPDSVNFDIELKYPMLWECPYWEMEPYWTEMNEYIDLILNVVFELGASRSIFFTCFNPEVCILLATKQETYPVVFLNDSMVSGPAGDQRATSLQQAMRFARQWGLSGIVMAAEPFVAAPKLIKYVKDRGLVCGSYGSMNDVPEFAKKQASEGIDMLIVNNVRLISSTLRSMTC